MKYVGGKMPDKFHVDVTANEFRDWLRDKVSWIAGQQWRPYRKGYVMLFLGGSDLNLTGPTVLHTYCNYRFETNEAEAGFTSLLLMTFNIKPVSTVGLDVVAECHNSDFIEDYRALLGRIAQRWPKAGLASSGRLRKEPGRPSYKANDDAYERWLHGEPVEDILPTWKNARGTADKPELDTLRDLKRYLKQRQRRRGAE